MRHFAAARYLLQDLLYDQGRSLLTILGLGVVVVSYLLVAALGRAFLASGKQAVNPPQNLWVMSADVLDPNASSMDAAILSAAVEAARSAFGDGAIGQAAPVLFRHMRIGKRVYQVAAVPQEQMSTTFGLTLTEGAWPLEDDQVAVSQNALTLSGWQVGERITIYGKSFTITGAVRMEGSTLFTVWMTYSAGEQLFDLRRGFQIGVLQVNPGFALEAVRAQVEAAPSLAGRYAVYLQQQISERFTEAARHLIELAYLFDLIALLILTFGAYNAASLTLLERSREVAVLRAVGYTPGAILGLVLGRSSLLTAAAYLSGWLVAWALTQAVQARSPIVLHALPITLDLTPGVSWLGLGLALLFSGLGAWLPARQQGHMSVAEQARL
jgi:ABC-type antimicrobial peptide transport system permease subunit